MSPYKYLGGQAIEDGRIGGAERSEPVGPSGRRPGEDDGFGELMRSVSLQYVPPDRRAGPAVFPAIDLIEGPYLEVDENFTKAFRPKK